MKSSFFKDGMMLALFGFNGSMLAAVGCNSREISNGLLMLFASACMWFTFGSCFARYARQASRHPDARPPKPDA